MGLKVGRQYVNDLNIRRLRPKPVRDMRFDAATSRLSWTPPVLGPDYTHVKVRVDDDSAPAAYVLPKGGREVLIPFAAMVIVTTWNEISRTESEPAYLQCTPTDRGQARNRLAYAWAPKGEQPDADDPYFDETDWGFRIQQFTKLATDQSGIVEIAVRGRWPVNVFSELVTAPLIGEYGSTVTSGGTIAGGYTYYVAICSVDANGLLSEPSLFCKIKVASGSTNTITIPIVSWNSASAGYKVFAGRTIQRLTWQAEGSTKPSSITLTAYQVCNAGMPDAQFRRMKVQEKRIFHSGVFGSAITGVAANTLIVAGAGWTAGQWVGYVASVIGKLDDGPVPFWNFTVSGNTTDTLTMTPDPAAEGVTVGDAIVMRSKVTVGSDAGGNYVEDSGWMNSIENGGAGLLTNGEVGRLLRFTGGPGRGYEYRIKSNTATRIYIDGAWTEAPTSASMFVICEVLWQTIKTTPDLANSEFTAELTLSAIVPNEDRLPRLVRVLALNDAGDESVEELSPEREIFIWGDPGLIGLDVDSWALGMCDPLTVANDLGLRGHVHLAGFPVSFSIGSTDPSSSGRVVVDIKATSDHGTTWRSIFGTDADDKLVMEAGQAALTMVKSFDPDNGELLENDQLRADVIEAGTGCQYVRVKGRWRPQKIFKPGNRLDGSDIGNAGSWAALAAVVV